jgi:RNA polymerase sigma factor (sigma-70 family)
MRIARFAVPLSRRPARAFYPATISLIIRGIASVQPSVLRDATQLNRRWRPALMSFFLRRVSSHAEAEDLTQEVFARLLVDSDRSAKASDAYVFQIAANLLRDGARRSKVRSEYREAIGVIHEDRAELFDPARIASGHAALAALIAGLESLPERTRAIFTLYRIENVEMSAIAEGFGISKSAVKKQVMKAMAALTMHMKEFR